VTEVDGMDTAGGGSREADKITQLEGRTTAFGDRARVYLECTVSIEAGRIWQEITQGTDSRIALRCPFCRAYVTPEREHLLGWQDAPDVAAAKERARLVCPACGELWDDQDRREANADAVLLHRGQSIDDADRVAGDPPRTETLGFRWTAANNLLVPRLRRLQGVEGGPGPRRGEQRHGRPPVHVGPAPRGGQGGPGGARRPRRRRPGDRGPAGPRAVRAASSSWSASTSASGGATGSPWP
jgi:hypothetical protein